MKLIAGSALAAVAIATVWALLPGGPTDGTAPRPALAAGAAAVAATSEIDAPAATGERSALAAGGVAATPDRGTHAAPARPIRLAQALFQEGVHFERLPSTQPTSSPAGVIEVTEFFMYSCPHCRDFEPHVQDWLEGKPENVNFVRVPASFNRLAQFHAKAFYAAEMLGVLEDVHEDLFAEIHEKRNPLNSERLLTRFFVEHGVDGDEVRKAMKSFPVDAKLKKATTMAQRYGVRSVPSVYVNGKYRTSAAMAGDYPTLLRVIDYLVAREASAGNRSASATGN